MDALILLSLPAILQQPASSDSSPLWEFRNTNKKNKILVHANFIESKKKKKTRTLREPHRGRKELIGKANDGTRMEIESPPE